MFRALTLPPSEPLMPWTWPRRFLVNAAITSSPDSLGTPPPFAPPFLNIMTGLESAILSSAEVAPATLLRAIPAELRSLELLCLAREFPFHPAMLDALQDRTLTLALEEWKVVDCRESWTVKQVRDVGEACEARGVRFMWEPGEAETDSSGSTGSSCRRSM